WKRVVGVVVEVVEWTGMEESGGKIVGGKNGLNATVFAILTGKDGYCYKFGDLTQLVPGVIKD
nr:hypothetical protein [Tanacetum cinerariifolium]